MTRALLILVALLALLTSTTAVGQICIDFDPWCDGFELTITGNSITGFWRNADCDGTDVPVMGVIHGGIDNPCGPEVGRVGIACEGRFGCEFLGDEWYYILNEEEGNWDLGHSEGGGLDPPGACWFENIEYHIVLGPCPFFGERPGKSLLSTVQAGR